MNKLTLTLVVLISLLGLNSPVYAFDTTFIGRTLGAAAGAALGTRIGSGSGNQIAVATLSNMGGDLGQSLSQRLANGTLFANPQGQAYQGQNSIAHGRYEPHYTTPPAVQHAPVETSQNTFVCKHIHVQNGGASGNQSGRVIALACKNPDGSWEIR